MTADIHQQRRVINNHALAVGEANPLGEAEGDDALAQHMFHGLPETQINPERQRGHELRQTQLLTTGAPTAVTRETLSPPLSQRHGTDFASPFHTADEVLAARDAGGQATSDQPVEPGTANPTGVLDRGRCQCPLRGAAVGTLAATSDPRWLPMDPAD